MSGELTREQHLDLYYFMQLNRQLEERMVRQFRQNKIVGGVYSSLGQEGVSVGTSYALEPRDWLARAPLPPAPDPPNALLLPPLGLFGTRWLPTRSPPPRFPPAPPREDVSRVLAPG